METETIVGRFAPSPTGRMHLGNVYAALLSWLSCKSQGGQWLLRIEDIDPQRSKQQWTDFLLQDLEWLGLTWDKGPFYQSQRGAIYEHYLTLLRQKGVIYPSYKTRAERLAVSAPQKTDILVEPMSGQKATLVETMSGQKAALVEPMSGQKAADTLRVADKTVSYVDGLFGLQTVNIKEDIGDFIVRRRDGAWAYQLAVVVDDALMGVTEVVRGCDLLQSAAQQIYLCGLLGLPIMRYAHVPLLCNVSGQRLSKRDKSLDMGVLRTQYSAEEIIGHLACYAGLLPEPTPFSPTSLIQYFSWAKIPVQEKIFV